LSQAVFTLLYGFVGVVAEVPIAFAINVTQLAITCARDATFKDRHYHGESREFR